MIETPALQIRTVSVRGALREAAEHYHAGRHEQARTICQQLLQQRPNNAQALHLLGVLEIQRSDFLAALPYFEQALPLQDGNPEFHSNYGALLSHLKRPSQATAQLRRAIELKPDYGEAHLNLATILLDRGDFSEALAEFQHALTLNPRLIDAHLGVGCAQNHLRHIPEAIEAFRQVVALKDDHIEARCNLAMMLLGIGDFGRGWREYEVRVRAKNWGPRPFRVPRWNGESVQGRTLLVISEQGLGDTIQFVRYFPELRRRGATIVFECHAPLKRLLSAIPDISLLIDWPRGSDVESGVDYYVPLLSLPFHLGTTLETIPNAVPYLYARDADVEGWRAKINGPGLKVGLVWSGNPQYAKDRFRSCTLADFAAFAKVPNTAFYSLQKGPAAEQVASPPSGMALVDLNDHLSDFADTAAAIHHLDLVISVDTSVAHLAGALGKAVWTLLPFAADWRWMHGRLDSPWYPTMRLFRQERPLSWSATLEQIADALAQLPSGAPPVQVLRAPLPLEEAVSRYEHGQLAGAEHGCRQVLKMQPNHGKRAPALSARCHSGPATPKPWQIWPAHLAIRRAWKPPNRPTFPSHRGDSGPSLLERSPAEADADLGRAPRSKRHLTSRFVR